MKDQKAQSRQMTGDQGQMGGMVNDRSNIHSGMQVVGSDGGNVGQVKEVRGSDFLIDRPMARDVYAPLSACQTVSTDQVRLNLRADQIDEQGWSNPK